MSEIVMKKIGRMKSAFAKTDIWDEHYHEKHLLNKPIYLEGKNKEAVLLMHGWTSTPYEFQRISRYLHKKGYTVYAPLLSGHGTVPKDLEGMKWETWYKDVEKAFKKLKKEHTKVFVGGVSMGGNLALLLAQKNKSVSGLLLFGTPYKMRAERLAYYWTKIVVYFKKYKKKRYPPTSAGQRAITRVTAYSTYPTMSAFEAYYAIRESRKNLHKIKQPCFIMQSYHDHLLTRDSVHDIYEKIFSTQKKKRYIHNAYHTFVADKDCSHIYKDILRFLQKAK